MTGRRRSHRSRKRVKVREEDSKSVHKFAPEISGPSGPSFAQSHQAAGLGSASEPMFGYHHQGPRVAGFGSIPQPAPGHGYQIYDSAFGPGVHVLSPFATGGRVTEAAGHVFGRDAHAASPFATVHRSDEGAGRAVDDVGVHFAPPFATGNHGAEAAARVFGHDVYATSPFATVHRSDEVAGRVVGRGVHVASPSATGKRGGEGAGRAADADAHSHTAPLPATSNHDETPRLVLGRPSFDHQLPVFKQTTLAQFALPQKKTLLPQKKTLLPHTHQRVQPKQKPEPAVVCCRGCVTKYDCWEVDRAKFHKEYRGLYDKLCKFFEGDCFTALPLMKHFVPLLTMLQHMEHRANGGHERFFPSASLGCTNCRKRFPCHSILAMEDKDAMRRQSEDGWQLSHLCHNPACRNITHITLEPREVNLSRNSCRAKVGELTRQGGVIPERCERHEKEKPCLLHCCALNTSTILVREYLRFRNGVEGMAHVTCPRQLPDLELGRWTANDIASRFSLSPPGDKSIEMRHLDRTRRVHGTTVSLSLHLPEFSYEDLAAFNYGRKNPTVAEMMGLVKGYLGRPDRKAIVSACFRLYNIQYKSDNCAALCETGKSRQYATYCCPFCRLPRYQELPATLKDPQNVSKGFSVYANAMDHVINTHPEVPPLLKLKLLAKDLRFPQIEAKLEMELNEAGIPKVSVRSIIEAFDANRFPQALKQLFDKKKFKIPAHMRCAK